MIEYRAIKKKSFLWSILSMLMLAILILTLSPLPSFAQREEDIARQKSACSNLYRNLKIAVLENNPPFSWIIYSSANEEKVKAYGVGYEILKEILDKAKIKYTRLTRISNQEKLQDRAFANEAFDILIGLQYHPTVDINVQRNFIRPSFLINHIVPVFLKDKLITVNSDKDLQTLRGAVLKQDNIKELFPSLALAEANSSRELFLALKNDEIDYALMSYYLANMDVKKFKIQDKITISDKVLRSLSLFLGVGQNSPCLVYQSDFMDSMQNIVNDKEKMGNILYKVYNDYEEQNKDFPALF